MAAQRRITVAVATIATLVLAGCGSGSAEPEPKDWSDDGSKSQQKNQGEQSSGDKQNSDGGDGDGETIVRGDDTDRADKQTDAQVEDFMADYLDAENDAIKDGDFSDVKPMVEDCTICEENWSYIEGAYQDGGKVEGGLFVDPEISAGQQHDGAVFVDVVSKISAYTTTDGSGTEVESGEAEELRYQFSVEKKDGGWKIVSGRLVE